jgi:DNA-damage-inducible protein J
MAQTNVNIRMDENTKRDFDLFCKEIGISVSAAFNLFARTVVREHRIPFEITTDVPNKDTTAATNEYYEMLEHPEKYKRYSSFKEAMNEVLEDA